MLSIMFLNIMQPEYEGFYVATELCDNILSIELLKIKLIEQEAQHNNCMDRGY